MPRRGVLNPAAVEQVHQLRAQLRQLPLRQPLHRRDRGIGASPVSMTSSMPRSGGSPGGAPPSTSAYSTLSAAKAASSSQRSSPSRGSCRPPRSCPPARSERVAQTEMNQDRRPQPLRSPSGRRCNSERPGLPGRRQAERHRQTCADNAMHRARVQQDRDAADACAVERSPDKRGLNVGSSRTLGRNSGEPARAASCACIASAMGVHRGVDPVSSLGRPQVIQSRLRIPRPGHSCP
jgi:hypothetical protein